MKINKFLIIFSIAVTTLLVSCEDFEDTEVASPTVSTDMVAVTFAAENPITFEFDPLDTGFDITVMRSTSTSALEVPISVVTNTDNSFTVPTTVSFAAGEETATIAIVINYDNATLGMDLEFGIKVADANSNPYLVTYSEYYATIAILDWQKYAEGNYYSALFDDTWTQDLYKLAGEDTYRFFNLYAEGTDLTIGWDGGNAISYDAVPNGNYFDWESGLYMDGYGDWLVSWDSGSSYSFYDDASSTFQLEGYWTASIYGGWGWLDDLYEITSLY